MDGSQPPAAFTPTARSRVKRLHERGHYDRVTVYGILDAGFICHVGYVIDGAPYTTPTSYWREGDRIYWHGSSASRMLRRQAAGIPVCITVTHVDGLVIARSAFHHSINYRAVMAFGMAEKIEEPAAKAAALRAFVERLYPGRWDTLRPITAQELKATTVLSMIIDEASAKIRTGQPVDDEPDYALPIWAGVIGLHSRIGATASDPRLAPSVGLPADIAGFADGAALDELLRDHVA